MVKIADLVADARTSTAPTWGSDTLSLTIPAPVTALPPVICWSCEDTETCRDCNGHGEFYPNSGTLSDCRNCDGHGVCLDCTEPPSRLVSA